MFKSVIASTPLVSESANAFFKNIRGDSFHADVTFLSTLRALVAPRMSEEDTIALSFTSSEYGASTVRNHGAQTVLGAICRYPNEIEGISGIIQIHSFKSSSPNDNTACLELVESSFEKCYSGWHRIDKVTDFFRKTFAVLCFINPEKKSVYIFTDRMDVQKMHYLQCSIFAFLPWYFDPEAGVSELEMKLIESLRKKTSHSYENCIAEIASQYDFRTQRIRNLLSGFELRYERQERDRMQEKIQAHTRRIEELNQRIGEHLRDKAETEIRLLGLEAKIAQGASEESEIMEYFLCNNRLVLNDVTDTEMIFTCMDYLTYFDEDMAKKMIDNERSYVYRPNGRACNNFIKAEDMKKLMYAIFIDQTLRMKMCSAYRFELQSNVRGLKDFDYDYECRECMPNPHIDRYSCMGNYECVINELLQSHDYIGAIEQCIASCKSLNFGDNYVMTEFINRIYGMSNTHQSPCCIELPDGKVVTPQEAIRWLKAQEQENNEDVQTQEGAESNE